MNELLIRQIEEYLKRHFLDLEKIFFSIDPSQSKSSWRKRTKAKIESLFKEPEDTFSQRLLKLIDERGRTDVEVYKAAHLDRRLFSKIRSDKNYKPSKQSAIVLAIALELTLEETYDLLNRAGYGLSQCIKEDMIVRFFIENQNYDINLINEVLAYYGLPFLGRPEA